MPDVKLQALLALASHAQVAAEALRAKGHELALLWRETNDRQAKLDDLVERIRRAVEAGRSELAELLGRELAGVLLSAAAAAAAAEVVSTDRPVQVIAADLQMALTAIDRGQAAWLGLYRELIAAIARDEVRAARERAAVPEHVATDGMLVPPAVVEQRLAIVIDLDAERRARGLS